MIKSFSDREAQRIWNGKPSKKLPIEIQNIARRKMRMINRAQNINDLRTPPGNRLEALSHDRKGQHSIRVNSQWRLCFEWIEDNAYKVEIVDYH